MTQTLLEEKPCRTAQARTATSLRPGAGASCDESPVARMPATRRIGMRPKAPPDAAIPAATPAIPVDEAAFSCQLLRLVPQLRAYARSLAHRADADDLMQDTLMRAWTFRDKYQPGTNLKAWLFTILRNLRLSGLRRNWRTRSMEPDVAENTLVANDDPSASEELLDVRNAMHRLPRDQRDALIMVGPAGLSYKETAVIWRCAEGTVKSRVSRAREALAAMMNTSESGPRAKTGVSSTDVFEEIMQHAKRLRGRVALT